MSDQDSDKPINPFLEVFHEPEPFNPNNPFHQYRVGQGSESPSNPFHAMHESTQAQHDTSKDEMLALTDAATTLTISGADADAFDRENATSRAAKQPRWWYRAWGPKSQGKPDSKGNILAGDQDLHLSNIDEIAIHYAEFHSDKLSEKPTALVSVTSNVIKAIKQLFWDWNHQRQRMGDDAKFFITAVCSAEYFEADHLLGMTKAEPLRSQISDKSYLRLIAPDFSRFHTTEAIFLRQIPRHAIRLQVSLKDLFKRGLRSPILPELEIPESGKNAWPKLIRRRIEGQYSSDVEVAKRYRLLYGILIHEKGRETVQSLKLAQLMMSDDILLSETVRDEGVWLFGAEVLAL